MQKLSIFWLLFNRLGALPIVIHILIGISPIHVLFVFILPLIKMRGRNFLKGGWNETPRSRNTYLIAYSYFLLIFFNLLSVFILCYELFIWSFCCRSGFVNSESALIWIGNPILEYCSIRSFWYSDLTDFCFRHHFLIF